MNIDFKAIIETIITYLLDVFKYFGYITDEDIANAKDFFTPDAE